MDRYKQMRIYRHMLDNRNTNRYDETGLNMNGKKGRREEKEPLASESVLFPGPL